MSRGYYGRGGMPNWLIKWIINALALLIVSYIPYKGTTLIEIDGAGTALIAALVLGIVNTFIRPVLVFFSLPVQFVTFGLFTLVINAAVLALVAWLMGAGLAIPDFGAAILGSILLSLTGSALNVLLRGDQ